MELCIYYYKVVISVCPIVNYLVGELGKTTGMFKNSDLIGLCVIVKV